jgi:hypothetical protein
LQLRPRGGASEVRLAALALAVALGACAGGSSDMQPGGGAGAGGASTSGNGGSGSGTGGTTGAGGATGAGGTSGAAGASMTGAGGAGTTGAGGAAGSTTVGACPPDATFCSSFEDAGLPAGSMFQPAYQASMWMMFMTLDKTMYNSGKQSLEITKPTSEGYYYETLSVPTPSPVFWVRVYMQSDVDFGQLGHNSFFSAVAGNGDPNNDQMEVSEQDCQVLLNHKDTLSFSGDSTSGSCGMCPCPHGGTVLPANMWHCVETFFDGTNGVVKVYANGQMIIDEEHAPKIAYGSLNFGYEQYHGPERTMWFDDVVVAPGRIGCP